MEVGHEWNNAEVRGGVYSWEFWESSWELMRVGRRRPSGRREMAGVGGLPESEWGFRELGEEASLSHRGLLCGQKPV